MGRKCGLEHCSPEQGLPSKLTARRRELRVDIRLGERSLVESIFCAVGQWRESRTALRKASNGQPLQRRGCGMG